MSVVIDKSTIKKFDVPGPRYTSYPTAPVWNDAVNEKVYIEKLSQLGKNEKTISLYLHIPFCQSMCTYCACNVIIRPHEEKYGDEYLNYLIKEMDLVASFLGNRKKIRQLHWGGGTPTFLTGMQIERLHQRIKDLFDIDENSEIAIEIDPRTIDEEKIKLLKKLGFNRISLGVQDFDEVVQTHINRQQSYSLVKKYVDLCRSLKFESINFDLIYGLPHQTLSGFNETIEKVIGLKPDRIALYSFAYVPWLKKHQQKIEETALPNPDLKLDLFLAARKKFLEQGYFAIAMDHFALENDEMALAYKEGSLFRNFMGYTVKPADEFIGLGLTSIGFMEHTFIQNYKTIRDYYRILDSNHLPVERGKELDEDDVIRQWTISSLMCRFKLDKLEFQRRFHVSFYDYFSLEKLHVENCQKDGLINEDENLIEVKELGKLFIRNICMGFDKYLARQKGPKRFSRTV